MAEDEDSAERHEGEVEDTAAIKAVAVLEPSSPDEAGLLYECLSMVRQRYIATAINGQPRQKPSVAKRRLKNIERALNEHRLPRRRALVNPGTKYFLRLAGVRHFDDKIRLKKLGKTERPGALKIFREKLDEENEEHFGQLIYLVTKAIGMACTYVEEPRGRIGVRLGRKREQVKTEAVIQLARLYQAFRNELPTRGDKRDLTRFERFLEEALGDLTGNKGTALARRWRRYEVKNAAGQNGVCLPPATA